MSNENDELLVFECRSTFDHPYPPTKIGYAPASYQPSNSQTDLIATTGDYLRLWSTDENDPQVNLKVLLNNNKHTGKLVR